MKQRLGLLTLLLLLSTAAVAQFTTSTATAESLIGEVVRGRGIKIKNIRFVGNIQALARFTAKGPHPAFADGMLLSTGIAAQAVGPNENPKLSSSLGTVGHSKMDFMANTRTFDAAIIEFEFQADRDSINIEFIFASEEYAEHVGSTFADPMVISISGPGTPSPKNIAFVPGTTLPVNINTVNITENRRYYFDNNPFTLAGKPNPARKAELNQEVLRTFQYDGMTLPISAGYRVTPKETYRLRIAIADAGDGNFDSALLIKAGSFTSLEQRRHVVARNAARERIVADSLARAEAREDSLAAVQAKEKGTEFERVELLNDQAEAPEETLATIKPTLDEAEEEDEGELIDDFVAGEAVGVDETPITEEVEEEEEKDAVEAEDEIPAGEARSYRTVIPFDEDSYFVPDDQEQILIEYGQLLKTQPEYQLGIYVPAAADATTNDLRYDMIRLEVIKHGARPTQVFKLGFSVNDSDTPMPTHRAELLIKTAE
jgi:hypothetical protein